MGAFSGNSMERLLVLMTTTTYKAAAFLEAARRLGLDAVVGSERPQALAGLNPTGHLTLDFGDPEGAARAIAAAGPFAAVVAADDEGAVTAAAAARILGLPHSPVEAVRAARSKRRTRERLSEAGLQVP